ncbi:MAG: DoxX family protein [Sinomicrobium sp.]|nr:DoxX family protein [Sinomicrobium sp.]
MSKKTYYIERFSAIVAAVILLQTLYYKFTGHEDSVYIFQSLGMEPEGRIVLGVAELIIAVLLLFGRTAVYGAILGVMVLLGALISHLFILGISVRGDGGKLFILAVITFVCCVYVLFARAEQFHGMFVKNDR